MLLYVVIRLPQPLDYLTFPPVVEGIVRTHGEAMAVRDRVRRQQLELQRFPLWPDEAIDHAWERFMDHPGYHEVDDVYIVEAKW